jgi:hypothetical protein
VTDLSPMRVFPVGVEHALDLPVQRPQHAATTFEGEFSNVTSSYAGKGVVRYTW